MKFAVHYASKGEFNCKIEEINTIEELIAFKEKAKHDIIIEDNTFYTFGIDYELVELFKQDGMTVNLPEGIEKIPYSILVYDDYIE